MKKTIEADIRSDYIFQWLIPHTNGHNYRLTYHRKRKVWDVEVTVDGDFAMLVQGYGHVPRPLMRELGIGELVA